MKQTHVLIAVLTLMSMTAAVQVAHAQGGFPAGMESPSFIGPVQGREGRLPAMTSMVGDRAHSKQTRCMSLGKC